jgi:hypothetical protein
VRRECLAHEAGAGDHNVDAFAGGEGDGGLEGCEEGLVVGYVRLGKVYAVMGWLNAFP